VTIDPDSTQTSRMRLLAAGKTLFAQSGYEQTSTSAIARSAGTSESQLMRYFGGKAGLLDAIFNESWSALTGSVGVAIAEAPHAREAILALMGLMLAALTNDSELAVLFLFEGRRMRGATHEVALSKGFVHFWELLCQLIGRGQTEGSFRADVQPVVLASAMLGCAEGMMRDRLLAERGVLPNPFGETAVRNTFEAMVNGLAP
jgi:AcrR family transcriptional regulator